MEKQFESGDGLAILDFLKGQLKAEVPYVGERIVHLRLSYPVPDGDVIGFTEVMHRCYEHFFNRVDLCLLHELPLVDGALVYCVYCAKFWQDELAKRFGGFRVGNYWLLNNETRSYYGYTTEELPTAQDIIDFLESFQK